MSKTKQKDNLLDTYILDAGTYIFYDNYIVAEIKEGSKVTIEQTNELIPLIEKHYGEQKPFGYISNRINSYSIVPLNYLHCPGIYMKNFKGFAVVTYSKTSALTAQMEEHFVKTPFKQFDDLDDAIFWIKNI